MNRIQITPELVERLIGGGYTDSAREEQRFIAEDTFALAQAIGERMCEHFTLDTYNSAAYMGIAKWLVGDPSMVAGNEDGSRPVHGDLNKGIYLHGEVGVGKTLCLDIFRIVAKYLDIQFDGKPLRWTTFRTDEVCAEFERTGELDNYRKIQCVCFQDLGSEPQEVLYMGNRRNVMRSVLEYRGDMKRGLTLITSNLPITKIGEYYGQRVQSRLMQMCNILTIGGGDRRR